MIPIIGIMIASYIITRMLDLVIEKKGEGKIIMVFAAVTIAISLYCIYQLLSLGSSASNLLNGL